MIENSDDISTSGFVPAPDYAVSSRFSGHSELPSRGYCQLFKAQRNGQWFVLKALQPEYQQDPVYQGMLEKEYDLMMQLNHPSIVRIYSKEKDSVAGVCMVMEFVDGRTLGDFLAENPPQSVRESVARQILEAIGYCHGKQIIHRDLKPSNILVTYNGNRVKLIDFGLSDSDQYAVLKEPAYTKAYAAPEQLSGGEIDNRTDLYALGLILKQLFPNRYGGVVRKCLQPKKENRYSSAEEIEAAMASVEHWRKRWPWIMVALVCLTALIPVMVLQKGKNDPPTKMGTDIDKVTDSPLAPSNSRTDSTGVAATVAPATSKVSTNEADMDVLDRYCYNLRYELDSIIAPFDKEVKNNSLKYRERFHSHKAIALLKMSIYIQQRRQQLPQHKHAQFQQYAGDLWNRYAAKYSYQDAKGNDLYPYYYDLHKENKISDEEYVRLCDEYEKDVAEINRLSEQLKKETAKE
jgi:serine/threonine protein kinase